ncbi:WD repeat and FYVE domain-containing protein 3 [Geodia barretti]|uniref:WD repeat and FYVE domain-containing protein 3 n=1 Tax=Geodia barretti TaxID=519541 RepID=A0AA35S5Y3_GEOBA|nr:WD repeat and FYVE domain-containing protein 3 [Geodia barretti]
MGAQNSQRLKRFIERYNLTKEDPTGEGIPPFYYGTHYSSAMIVASYLIRMEPFTGHFIKLQGGHFDLADRLFHSIPLAWVSASCTNMADIKELIPEFFYLPEFLSNSNHFDLGTKQSGEPLGDVILPPWAKGCPIEFIRLHREALESDHVSAHLHEWIDLIFGYKQTGKEALRAHNVFHYLFYEGAVDIEKIDDPVKKGASISFIHNFGQMPKQLFKRPHPARKVFSYSATPSLSAPPVAMDTTRVFYKNLTQLMPSREPVKEIRGEVHHISLVGDRTLLALDRNKLPLPPLFSRYFMWGFPDRSARVASVEADKVVSVFENLHQGRILCSTMPHDNMLLTGGDSTIVCVWEMKNVGSRERSPVHLQLKHTLHGHTDSVTCIAASTAFNIIVSGSKDQTCIIWDINKMVFVRQLQEHTGPVTMAVISQSNGNIVSCTKSQICLWTVNGRLLASTTILITGNFSLLCCTVSEMFDWDQDNVIVTGSTDGIVRMWVVEYVKEGEHPQSPVKKKESNLDSPVASRPAALVQKMQRLLSQTEVPSGEGLEGARIAKTETGRQDDMSSANGMSSDSEDDVYSTPQNTTPESKRKQSDEGKDNPLYHTDLEQDTNRPIETTAPHNGLEDRGLPLPGALTEDGPLAKSDTLSVKTPDRTRSSSLRESSERETGAKKLRSRVSQHPCNIPIKTQIDTSESDGNTLGSEVRQAGQGPPSSPEVAHCLEEAKRRARELREKAGQWTRRLTLVHTLTMHTAMSRKDNDTPAAVTSLCISRDHRRLYVGDSRGRVFSWTVSDSQGGVMEHWLRDEAVDKCMKCSADFTFTERKHHCRDCGKIFCHRCSAYESEVKRLRIFKKVRVCEECYKNLRPKQSPKI